jgi:hypothetical protein
MASCPGTSPASLLHCLNQIWTPPTLLLWFGETEPAWAHQKHRHALLNCKRCTLFVSFLFICYLVFTWIKAASYYDHVCQRIESKRLPIVQCFSFSWQGKDAKSSIVLNSVPYVSQTYKQLLISYFWQKATHRYLSRLVDCYNSFHRRQSPGHFIWLCWVFFQEMWKVGHNYRKRLKTMWQSLRI